MWGEVLQKDRPGWRWVWGHKACSARGLKGMSFGRHGEATGSGKQAPEMVFDFCRRANVFVYEHVRLLDANKKAWQIYAKVAKPMELLSQPWTSGRLPTKEAEVATTSLTSMSLHRSLTYKTSKLSQSLRLQASTALPELCFVNQTCTSFHGFKPIKSVRRHIRGDSAVLTELRHPLPPAGVLQP